MNIIKIFGEISNKILQFYTEVEFCAGFE